MIEIAIAAMNAVIPERQEKTENDCI